MAIDKEQIREMMADPRYPFAAKYDPDWIIGNEMGSHCLWLMEGLCREMRLKPGMRILDMGCGKAISSIFLAREFGAQVWATDLWIPAAENWDRIKEAGLTDRIFPIHADARALPFADEFFDAAVSINTFQFFGTDDTYLRNNFVKYIKPGGQIGIVVPGIFREFEDGVPDYLKKHWNPEFFNWHSPHWWRRHWERTGLVHVETADTFPEREGFRIFKVWELIMDRCQGDNGGLIHTDDGRNITFVRMIARRNGG
ncbi:MAG: SAM-dependent methyltransferase [Bacillota bacterium]